jgi:Uma2 family endonuclease
MTQTTTSTLTVEEFMRLYSDEKPFEIVGGEIVPMTPQNTLSGMIAGELFIHLSAFVKSKGLGQVFIEVPFVMTSEADWVTGSRVPDVMFVGAERIAQLEAHDPHWKTKPLMLVPDLVAEIVSPTDRASGVSKKVARYLQDGVRVVWLIDPEIQSLTIHILGSNQITQLGSSDTLTGGEVIPGFEMVVGKLF